MAAVVTVYVSPLPRKEGERRVLRSLGEGGEGVVVVLHRHLDAAVGERGGTEVAWHEKNVTVRAVQEMLFALVAHVGGDVPVPLPVVRGTREELLDGHADPA